MEFYELLAEKNKVIYQLKDLEAQQRSLKVKDIRLQRQIEDKRMDLEFVELDIAKFDGDLSGHY